MINQYIRQYGKRLYGLCLKLCANSADADDLYQETWLRVIKCVRQYDPCQPFEPWLTKICVNTYRNVLRRIARSPFIQFRTEQEQKSILQQIPAPEQEKYAELHDAIDKLPGKLRVTIILFYFHDMNVSAVARTLGVPEGTVKSRLSKARKLLKEVLEHEANL
ncbi:MAG: sigma-70 family RNA polymerase sigma factor [Bacillota bacterium]|nr:sigma-70 family RNA polymerase sigma factor [Bacillota bacterium]